jgi:hypothetical protein
MSNDFFSPDNVTIFLKVSLRTMPAPPAGTAQIVRWAIIPLTLRKHSAILCRQKFAGAAIPGSNFVSLNKEKEVCPCV